MTAFPNSIFLMGFKHVGKSVIGKALAERTQIKFTDLDTALEMTYQEKFNRALSCREIYTQYGETVFSELEHETLKKAIATAPSIIALGGGTPLHVKNQLLIQSGCAIHLKADPEIIYERIMATGIPAFFDKDLFPKVAFDQLFKKRNEVYAQLATLTIDNSGTIERAVNLIISNLR